MGLIDVFADLATLSVNYGGLPVDVKGLSVERDYINPDALPYRIQLLQANQLGDTASIRFVDNNNLTGVSTWNIGDLLLIVSANSGGGTYLTDPNIAAYIDDFKQAVQQQLSTCLAANSSQVQQYTVAVDYYEFPIGSDEWYVGVLVNLEVMGYD